MKVRHGILVALGMVLVPPAVVGQVTALSVPAQAEKPDSEKSVPLIIHPASEPQPSLRYQLLPPFIERRPGNAAVWWNRLPAEETHFFNELYKEGGVWEKVEKWMEIPIGDPREKGLRPKADEVSGGSLFSDMEHAARFESCDWELPIHEGGVITMRLPDLNQMRTYGRMLSAKARLEIAEGRYDQAVRTLQTGFALARDAAKGPTLVHALVGTAIATMMTDRIQEMIQQPNSPNLYWALSTLPRPTVDFRPGFEAEIYTLYLEIPDLQNLDKKQLPPDEWRALLLKLVRELRTWGSAGFAYEADALVMTGLSLQGYPQAKQFLVEHGRSAAEVEAMPVAQVILLYTLRVYDELDNDMFKWLFLPYTEASTGMDRAERHLKEAIAAKREIIPVAGMLLPAVQRCKQAEARISWRVARLRIVEALRMYAATHGRLPDRLDQISDVPLPLNPFDGKPFTYRRDGEKADLGCEAGPIAVPWRLEITLAGKDK